MVLMPTEVKGEKRKLARPFHGPFRVLIITPTSAKVRVVDDPKAASIIFVALDRVRLYYPEQADVTWTGRSKRRMATHSSEPDTVSTHSTPNIHSGPVTRSMTRVNTSSTLNLLKLTHVYSLCILLIFVNRSLYTVVVCDS